MINSGDVISCHHSLARCPMILWIMGIHIAHRIGSNQLRHIALFTPRLVEDKFENFIADFCCFLIEFDGVGERLWSDASVAVWELSDDGVVVVVVLVLIDIFFNDDFLAPLWSVDVEAIVYIADVSISNSDWIIKTMATRVDELSRRIAAKLELNSPYHSWKWHNNKNALLLSVSLRTFFCFVLLCQLILWEGAILMPQLVFHTLNTRRAWRYFTFRTTTKETRDLF